ncbi:hypothetical protein IFM89_038960 [Coptis chinensis]|uniref:Pre-mRNA-splicing factor ISY1 n=1 Tax=Coptis chinensis TaxID=261450 RepID=A0A835J1W0_9MAGN|nr:hypothetical protein IFM89_038960 [Coptis chinensis]
MARNEEKAQSMLNRYITAKNEENKKPKERRPFLASEYRDLYDADKWRQQIMSEIGHSKRGASVKMTDLDGNIVDVPNPSGRGPGYDIFKRIDASYYGYHDDEDGIIEKLEGPAAAVKEWQMMENIKLEAKRAVKSGEVANAANILFEEEEDVVEEERKAKEEENQKEQEFGVHVPLPDEREIEKMVLAKKK